MKGAKIKSYLIALINLFALNACSQNPEPETYLIPQGFTGRVNIVFNRADGMPTEYEDGRRVYQIPGNGILQTQFRDEYGVVDRHYYYIDSNGKRTPLHIYKHDYDPDGTVKWGVTDSNEVGIFLDGTTGQYNNRSKTKSVKWQEFAVYSYKGFQNMEPMDSFTNRVKKFIGFDF